MPGMWRCTSKLKFWLRSRVCLNNGCQHCPSEGRPLAGRLAAAHVAGHLCLFIWTLPRAACLHPSCPPPSRLPPSNSKRHQLLSETSINSSIAVSQNETGPWAGTFEMSHHFCDISKQLFTQLLTQIRVHQLYATITKALSWHVF